jgi:two-component system phosphate regulon sensor histidine kinase PhoR
MVITLVGLVILTAVAIGVPAVLYVRSQAERYALQTLEQGSRTVQALVSERRSQLDSLALLTAQRPTLSRLASQDDPQELRLYLQELQLGAGLDLLLLCGPDGKPVLAEEAAIAGRACSLNGEATTLILPESGLPQGWLLAVQPLPAEAGGGSVVTGQALDDRYARELRERAGLDLALYLNGEFLASSFETGREFIQAGTEAPPQEPGLRFTLNGDQYYHHRVAEGGSGLAQIFFYPASEIASQQGKLTLLAGGGILLVILLSSAIGVARARQISLPLERLRSAAEGLRMGDLASPVRAQTEIREVKQVAQGLEGARRALQHSLGQLRQEKAWVEHLLEAVVEGILTIDRGGCITFFSQGAERITGWKAEAVLGRSLDEVFQVADEKVVFSQRIPAPGGLQKIPVFLEGGRQKTLSVTGARLAPPEAGRARAVLVLRDVSDEEAIRRLLGEFLANISHEFRTPLTAVGASIELLMDQLSELTPEELSELLGSIHLGVLNLQTLIDNLLEGASIETGRFRVYPRQADVYDIVRQTVAAMQPLAEKYGQTIEIDLPDLLPPVQADPRRTGQAIVNLLSNAIKWGPAGGRITITAAEVENAVQVWVADQGPGIPSELLGDLFLRFDRARLKEGRGEYGAGLGLSVVKAVVEAQGGQVGASSQLGQGAVFWFTLPCAAKGGEKEVSG